MHEGREILSDYINDFGILVRKAVEFYQQPSIIVFPNVEELENISRVKLPDLVDSFQDGMDIYRSYEEYVLKSEMLIHAAVCFDIAYEEPPLEIRMAVIKLLILSRDYENACLYAFEFLTIVEVQRLIFEQMPLNLNGSYYVSHLLLPCWDSEVLLAVIMCELRMCKPMEQKILIKSLVYGQGELQEKPQPLLKAICAFIYAEMRKDKTKEQIQDINDFVQEHEYDEIVEMFVLCFGNSKDVDHYQVSQNGRHAEWDNRRNDFKEQYFDKIKRGFFIYYPGMQRAVVLHTRLMNAYELTETETALTEIDLHVSLNQNIILRVDYIKHRGKVRLSSPEYVEFDEIKRIAERLRLLCKFGDNQELKKSFQDFISSYEIQSTLEDAKHYELFADDSTKLLKIFNRYRQIKWHNHEHALEMIEFLLKRHRKSLLGNSYITFFNYYMQFKEYNRAEIFLNQYRNELGDKYYHQATIQLQECGNQDSKSNRTYVKKVLAKTKWHPLPLGEGYGNYVSYFLKKGAKMLEKERLELGRMSEKELREEHDRIIQFSDERSVNPIEEAKCFLKAGAVLNICQKQFCCNDMSEEFAEDMIDAFYHFSRNEMSRLNIDHDMLHSYQEQALHLSGHLHPDYLSNSLRNMFEEMLKRYFKDRPGHDNDSLAESVKHMSQMATVTDEEFCSCLMRISLYYPSFLMRTEIMRLLRTDNEVKRRIAVYMQSRNWIMNTRVEMVEVLQEYRNQLALEYNNCDFRCPTDNIEELKEKLKNGYDCLKSFKSKNRLYGILSESDRNYIEKLMDLLRALPEGNTNYVIIRKYNRECTRLREDIDQRPSSFAVEHLYVLVVALEEYSKWRHSTEYKKLNPIFSADVLFAENSPRGNDWISVYLKFGCCGGMSGVFAITARILASKNVYEGEFHSICDYVERDGKEYGFIPIRFIPSEEVKMYLPFEVEFEFMVEETQERKSIIAQFCVSMENRMLDGNYEQMYNPGSTLCEGNTMAEYTFCGRDSLINRICRRFYDFPNSMVVLYGQRKVGKTTIANYVVSSMKKSGRRFLLVNCGNLSITLYNREKKDCTEEIIRDFYANILDHLSYELESDRSRSVCIQEEIKEIKEATARIGGMSGGSVFSSLIRKLHAAFEREKCWRGTHILLWFDEFQQYYLLILKGRLQPEFVGFLKAFIEQYGFSLLLVGCEPMISFVHDIRFGNTFSAAEQINVEYLTREYAEKLICDPIPKKSGRQNPFKFVSDEIYRLSAGSPYFIQLICRNLIDNLNEQKKVFADKSMIINSLHKEGKVQQNNFDSLFASLNFQASSPDDNNRVLKRIAYRQKERTGSTRKKIINDLENITEKPAEVVLDELLARKVVEEKNGELRIVVRLYEEWIWENRIELGYDAPLDL